MKKTTKEVLKVVLPAAMMLSSGWNAVANVTMEKSEEVISFENVDDEKMYVEIQDADSSSLLAYVKDTDCKYSCGGTCSGGCESSCRGSCQTGCYRGCSAVSRN